MKEIQAKPLQGGISSNISSTNRGRSVSDVAIAEQFCVVATDMRSILQSLRVSNDIQKTNVDMIQDNSSKLDTVIHKLDVMIDHLAAMTDSLVSLNENVKASDETVKIAVKENQRHVDTMQIFLQLLEQHVDHLDESSTLMARSLLEEGAYTTLVNKIKEEKLNSKK